MAVLCTKRARSLNMFLVKSKINMSVCIWHAGMASANGNSDAATSTAEARSYDYLNEFYEQISTDSNRKTSHICIQIVPSCSEKQLGTYATNLKQHIELRKLTSLSPTAGRSLHPTQT